MNIVLDKTSMKVSPQRPDGSLCAENEIEVTPAMIEAGADLIWRAFGDIISYGSNSGRELALEVFEAMSRVAQDEAISQERSS